MMLHRNILLNLSLLSGLAMAAENLPSALLNQELQVPPNTLVVKTQVPAPKVSEDFSKKLVAAIRQQLALRMKRDASEFEVKIENLSTTPALVAPVTGSIQVLGMGSTGSQRLDGLMSLNLSVVTAVGPQELQVQGVLKVTGPVVVAKQILPRSHRIVESDLEVMRLPWRILASGVHATSVDEIVGQTTNVLISAGAAVHPTLLEDPLDVQSGDLVELLIQSGPGVIIRSRGVAKQEGRIGDTIRIEQPDTKKKLSAVIRGPKSVEVSL